MITGVVMHSVSWESKLYLQKEPASNLNNGIQNLVQPINIPPVLRNRFPATRA
jgi:hypothetical protein